MVVCVEEVLNFALEEIPKLIKATEALRVKIVRLESRNRHLSKHEDIPIIYPDRIKTAREEGNFKKDNRLD